MFVSLLYKREETGGKKEGGGGEREREREREREKERERERECQRGDKSCIIYEYINVHSLSLIFCK